MKPVVVALDDCSEILTMYQIVLEEACKALVYRTTDPYEALSLVEQHTPDLFITDLVHWGPDGVEITKQLRSNKRTELTPIWIISGQAHTALGKQAKRAGADLVVSKPFSAHWFTESANRLFGGDRITRYDYLLDIPIESPDIDYKERIDSTSRNAYAAIAKDIIAMANYGGGYLIFGVSQQSTGELKKHGLDTAQIPLFEVTKFNRSIREYIDPSHHVKSFVIRKGILSFAVVEIPPATKTLLLAKKQNDAVHLFPGRIYTRTSAAETAEVRDSNELRTILSRIVRRSGRRKDSVR